MYKITIKTTQGDVYAEINDIEELEELLKPYYKIYYEVQAQRVEDKTLVKKM